MRMFLIATALIAFASPTLADELQRGQPSPNYTETLFVPAARFGNTADACEVQSAGGDFEFALKRNLSGFTIECKVAAPTSAGTGGSAPTGTNRNN